MTQTINTNEVAYKKPQWLRKKLTPHTNLVLYTIVHGNIPDYSTFHFNFGSGDLHANIPYGNIPGYSYSYYTPNHTNNGNHVDTPIHSNTLSRLS